MTLIKHIILHYGCMNNVLPRKVLFVHMNKDILNLDGHLKSGILYFKLKKCAAFIEL